MKIRMAGACSTNFYQDLPGARIGHRHFTKFGWLLQLDELECSHDFLIAL
jgi:hypothetical protein